MKIVPAKLIKYSRIAVFVFGLLLSQRCLFATVDVQPLNVTPGSGSVAPGGSLYVSWQIRNNGTTTASSSYSQVRITSSSSSYGNSANNVGSGVATGTIGAGATINQNETVTVPSTPGTYYVWVIADNTSLLTQTTVANDEAVSSSFTVASAGTVDVQPLSVTPGSGSVAPGGSLYVSWQIRNNGTATASSSYSQVRITSSSSSYGSSANNVGSGVATGTIGAGATINQNETVTVPSSPGTYYVWVIADNTSLLTQTDVNNDEAVSSSFTITGGGGGGGGGGSIVAGFDSEFFPAHASTLADLIQRTNLRWCGYYLDAPNQGSDTGWLGERAYLESLGWQIAPIYVGQQDAVYVANWNAAHPNDQLSTIPPSSNRGVTDGNEAVAEMGPDTGAMETVYDNGVPKSVTQGQGFTLGTTVYLDWETGDIAIGADTDYIIAWCMTVAASGYQPGIYCPASNVPILIPLLAPYNLNVKFWAANFTQPSVPSTTTQFLTTDPTDGQANATSWQYGVGYSIQTVNGLFTVDLDTSSLYGNSSQPVLNVSTTSLTLPATTPGTVGATISFTVSGSGLGSSDTVTLSSASGSEISQNGSSGFVSTFMLYPDASGNLSTTTVYARISASATANVSGFLTVQDALHSSLNESIQVSGTDNSGGGGGGGSDTTAPTLSINSPLNGATVTSASLPVSGTATDNGNGNDGISAVTVNGVGVNGDTASGTGTANWNTTIALYSGANTITVIATDGVGNATQNQISVTYNPPRPVFGASSVNGGQLQTTLSGLSAQETVVFYVSSDLKNWTPVQTIVASGSTYVFSYSINPAIPGQYFRAVVQ